MNGESQKSVMGIVEFLKLLVLLYAALVPAGLWVRGEIKTSIGEWARDNHIVTTKTLDTREVIFRQELGVARAEELGPIITSIGELGDRVLNLEEKTAVRPPKPHYRPAPNPTPTPRPRSWDWPEAGG